LPATGLAIRQHFSISVALGTSQSRIAGRALPRIRAFEKPDAESRLTELALSWETDYSDNSPPAVQRRYQMNQRSPIVFWLLLAATLSVDAVAVFWALIAASPRAEALYFGLLCAQLSLVCIWASFSTAPRWRRYFALLAFMLISVLLTTGLFEPDWNYDSIEVSLIYLCLWTAHVLVLLTGIWCVRHTSFGQRWDQHAHARWQFSMKQVLAVMTLTPVAIVVLRETELIHDIWIPFLLWTANNVLLAMLAAIIYTARPHFVLRLAILAAISVVFGLAISLVPNGEWDSLAINLIQGAVLFIWLEIGEPIPRRAAAQPSVDGTSGAKLQPEESM
jgi:hypothetical protein